MEIPSAINKESALHPGRRLFVIEGTMVTSSKVKGQPEERRRAPRSTDSLNGTDNGL